MEARLKPTDCNGRRAKERPQYVTLHTTFYSRVAS